MSVRLFIRRFFVVPSILAVAVLFAASPAVAGLSPAQSQVPGLVATAAKYQPGDSRAAFRQIEDLVRQSVGDSGLRESLEAGLIQMLSPSATFEARRFACKQLGIIGGKAALPALEPMLKNAETAGIACLALTTYPPGKADDLLRASLPAAAGLAKIQIINTLGDRRDARSIPLLAPLGLNGDRGIATAAVGALGRMGEKSAWEALQGLAKNTPPELRPAVTEARLSAAAVFAADGDRKAAQSAYQTLLGGGEPEYVRRAAFAGLLALDKDSGEQRILQAIRNNDPVTRPVAIAAVRSLPQKDASARFAAQISQLPPGEQVWLIESLAVRGDIPARNAIASSLASKDAGVRRAAIAAMGQVGDNSTVGLFARTLAATPDADERRAIESALIALRGGPEINQAVIVELRRADGNARANLVNVLARRQGSAANIVLFEETTNANPVIAKAAFRGLAGNCGAGDASVLLQKVVLIRDPEVRAEAELATARALVQIDDKSDRTSIVRDTLRRAPSVETISALLILLPRCGDAAALSMLQSAQADPNPQIRDAAIRALAEWPDDSAWEALASIYRRPANETVRQIALRGLIRLINEQNARPDAGLIVRYQQLFDSAQDEAATLRLILGALSSASSPEALQLALQWVGKESVKPEAEAAVRKIADSVKKSNPDVAKAALEKLSQKP
jgi:HEAT repeat protein